MAYCAPKQLSACLPQIVPRLVDTLTDTHPKVMAGAKAALEHIGSVIRNPEISALVPLLLSALGDPNQHTRASLEALLQTAFVHSVDAPSLALIIPVLHRGLRERSTDTKKKAAQIVGNMGSLISDHKDVLPYLPLLVPELKSVLVDPIPEVRAIAAKALGTLIQGLGEEQFPDLVPWLLELLKSEISSVERSGAAQGLSEVISAVGIHRFDALLPDILSNMSNPKASVREGYLGLFVFLPRVLGQQLQPHIARILPYVLNGLADESDAVRESALRTGRALVDNYARSSLELLLPALEEGLFNDYWRIRHSSVQLLGDLLFRIAGTSGKAMMEGADSDDEGVSTDSHGVAIREALGLDRRNKVLSSLYMMRSDVQSSVRQAAVHVWKTVVSNTPRTLREILPVLMETVIDCLASNSADKRQVAGRALGELVRKLGDRVLPDIIPILQNGLEAEEGHTRQGVCVGLGEVMASAGRERLTDYLDDFILTIRRAVCDSDPHVRQAAAQTFNVLHRVMGPTAVTEIVPSLLEALEDPHTSAHALDGLRNILAVKGQFVLPFLLPKLTTPPINAFQANALRALADVAGPVLHAHLSILPGLIDSMASPDKETATAVTEATHALVLAVPPDQVHAVISELIKALNDQQTHMRLGACALLISLLEHSKSDFEPHAANILQPVIRLFNDADVNIRNSAWGALDALTKVVKKEELAAHITLVREAIRNTMEYDRRKNKFALLPGFCVPKGVGPLVPMFLHGLMFGSPEMREQAALGLGEIIDYTSAEVLKAYVIQITGPLIRIIGDRFPWQVKAAILHTLSLLISKGGVMLKPFLPQLQTTFVKSLHDPTKVVRGRAAVALGKLMSLNARVDALVTELVNGVKSTEGGVQEAMLRALRGVLMHSGPSVSPPVLATIPPATISLLDDNEEATRQGAAWTLGVWADFAKEEDASSLLSQQLLQDDPSRAWPHRHGLCLALAALLKHAPARSEGLLKQTVTTLKRFVEDDKVPILEAGAEACGYLAIFAASTQRDPLLAEMLKHLSALSMHAITDVRRAALRTLRRVGKKSGQGLEKHYGLVVPNLITCIKERNIPVRSAAERALYYVFQVKTKGMELVTEYSKKLDGESSRALMECGRRVLTKMTDVDTEASADELDQSEDQSNSGA
mmetsp:Transcript_38682/g.62654  ORF Transcript_38682/g.62654 Transcript_38682/m.62654 type:complete len:1156 (-) Transcript_38682:392-3859(-)